MDNCAGYAVAAVADVPDTPSGDADALAGATLSTLGSCGRARFPSTACDAPPDGVCDALSTFASESVSVKTTGSFNIATSFDASGSGNCASGFSSIKRMASEIVRSVGGAEMRRSRSSEIALSGERFKTTSGRGASSGGLS